MKEQITKNVIREVCNDFVDATIVGLEEYENDFPYTLACINFIIELKKKEINVSLNSFIDVIWDNIYKEISNYLAR